MRADVDGQEGVGRQASGRRPAPCGSRAPPARRRSRPRRRRRTRRRGRPIRGSGPAPRTRRRWRAARSTIGWKTSVRSSGSASSGRQSGSAPVRVPTHGFASVAPAPVLDAGDRPHPRAGERRAGVDSGRPPRRSCGAGVPAWCSRHAPAGRCSDGRGGGRAWRIPDDRGPPSPTRCTTATASLPPAGCSSRSPARPPSTGSRRWPRGSLGAGHAKVTLFTDQDTVVGGFGLPPGVVGGPALLTGALSAIAVRQRQPLERARRARRDERVADLPAVTSGQVRAYLGSPLVAASGHVVGVLTVYDPAPRDWYGGRDRSCSSSSPPPWSPSSSSSAARSAVGTSLTRLDVALEASSIGIWEQRPAHRASSTGTSGARRSSASTARPSSTPTRTMQFAVRPPRRRRPPSARPCSRRSTHTASSPSSSARCTRRRRGALDGRPRPALVNDSRGEPVRLLGTSSTSPTRARQAEQRLSAMHRATAIAEVAAELANAARLESLPRSCMRGAQVLGAQASALAVFDPDGGPAAAAHDQRGSPTRSRATSTTRWPASRSSSTTRSPPSTRRCTAGGCCSPTARRPSPGSRPMREALDVLGFRRAWPRCRCGWRAGSSARSSPLWSTDHPFATDDVEVLEALAAQIALSVSRLQADAERDLRRSRRCAEANRRLQVLAEAGRVLSGTLDIDQQVEQLAELVVPELGDWCWLVVTDEQGRLHEMARAHRDPARNAELAAMCAAMVGVDDRRGRRASVTATGTPVVVPKIDWRTWSGRCPILLCARPSPGWVPARAPSCPLDRARPDRWARWGCSPARSVARSARPRWTPSIEIGRRAGLALHHARLYGQQRDLADALQRSMLTDPPAAGPLADRRPLRAGRRRAPRSAATGTTRSCSPRGATVLAIGDVVGHDTRAAAAMGQVRGLLRGIGYSSGGSPAEVLTELDRAIEGLALDTMATALVARLEQDQRRPERGGRRAGCAGRAPAIRRRRADPRRRSRRCSTSEPADLLLGRGPGEPAPRARRRRSSRGSTVLLYTDGLVERRDRDIDAGTARAASRCCATAPTLRWTSCATRCWSGCSCPTRRTTSRCSPSGCTRRTGRARPRPGRRSCRRTSSPRPRSSPGRDGPLTARAPRSGRAALPPVAQPAAGARREVDGDRRLPAPPHRQHPQSGHQHDHDGGDRQRRQARAVRPGRSGSRRPAAPRRRCTGRAGRCRPAGRAARRGSRHRRPRCRCR